MNFDIDKEESESFYIPKVLDDNRSYTLNGTGYIFLTPCPLAEVFLQNECNSGKRLLEIGAGFNDIPLKALNQDVTEYVANDLSKEHLQILHKKVLQANIGDKIDRLKLIDGASPEILKTISGKFDAILADKVIHFFEPHELKEFIELAKSLLHDKSRLYITNSSVYSNRYNGLVEEYMDRKKKGLEFPGYFTDVMDRVDQSTLTDKNYRGFRVPNSMIFFTREDLITLFEKSGFQVVDSCALIMPTQESPEWIKCKDEESNFVGIVAEKI
jgi:Methyltransferase domain